VLELPYNKLTIYEIEEFYKLIIEKIKNAESTLELDFINIEKIDIVSIQLLLSLQQTCQKKSIKLILKNFSNELINTLKASGCDKVLEVQND